MAFKTLLTVLELKESGTRKLGAAINLAGELGAHLSVLIVGEVPHLPFYGGGGEGFRKVWLEQGEERARNLQAASAAVEAKLQAEGLSFDVRSRLALPEREDDVVARHAIYADLTVLLRSKPGALDTVEAQAIDGALFDSGRPVLFVPEPAAGRPIGRRIVVAWNARREAARAVSQALPLLQRAEATTLLVVDPEIGLEDHGEEPGADIALVLARHGLDVTIQSVPASEGSVAENLINRAREFGADLIVMGAYGHSRLRENILGGTTRDMLETSEVALFLSH